MSSITAQNAERQNYLDLSLNRLTVYQYIYTLKKFTAFPKLQRHNGDNGGSFEITSGSPEMSHTTVS